MEEEHNCVKAGGTATGHLFIIDNEWMFRCECGKYYEVEDPDAFKWMGGYGKLIDTEAEDV